jgi:hypothetical protein
LDARVTVYIPFWDGSAVSYDGERYTVHKRPLDIDADLTALSEDLATRFWRDRRGELVKALEDAWWKQREQTWKTRTKRIYRGSDPP